MKRIKNILKYVALLIFLLTLVACGSSKYQITFMDGSTVISKYKVESIEDLELDNPTKEGYVFKGWALDLEGEIPFEFDLKIDSDLKVYAIWNKLFEISFNSMGGSSVKTIEVEEGQIAKEPVNKPKKEGYVFNGWYTDEQQTNLFDFDQTISSNLTLYANWVEGYLVEFNTLGGSLISSVIVQYGENIEKPIEEPLKEGNVFTGWYLDIGAKKPYDFDTIIENELVLYAGWKQIVKVNFNTFGGTSLEDVEITRGTFLVEPNKPEKTDLVFEGWYLDDRFFERFNFDKIIYDDLTLYANFVDPVKLEVLMGDLNKIDLPVTTAVDISFPSKGESGTSLRFRSDSPKYITNTGKVSLAESNSVGAFVNISVTATYSGAKATIIIPMIIEPLPEEVIDHYREIEFESLAEEYVVKPGVIDFYYTENGAVPYVDIGEFIYLLDGAINSLAGEPVEFVDGDEVYWVVRYMEIVENTPTLITVKYIVEYYQDNEIVETDELEAVFDFEANTLTTENFDFFNSLGAETETDFGEGLTYGETTVEEGLPVVIEFNKYRIDLVTYEKDNKTKFLIPQAIANLVFVGQVYYDTYFNGDKLYGLDSYQFLDSSDEGLDLLYKIKTSSYNSQNIPKDLQRFNYDFIALTFDYFYGLKPNSDYSYYEFIGRNADDLMYGTKQNHYETMFKLIYRHDDLHTYHQMSGYYISPSYTNKLTLNMLGQRSQAYYQGAWDIGDLVDEKNLESSRVTPDKKTGIITIDSFDVDTPNQFKEDIDNLLAKYPSIKNIVVDISNNSGGNVGAVWRTLGYMTDDPIMFHSLNILDESSYSQEIFDLYPAYDLNFYIMISSVTFSAANLMAATAQELGIATIIGRPSSGGASSIGAVVTPTGDVFFMSSLSTMSMKLKDGTIASIEYGIKPDIMFSSISKLYDDAYIEKVVNDNQPQ